ncbi:MAG: class A beta-lactamase-related serine hydrolase [Patescibacteria group bacterium]|nr:class A beta-lactamase-related serine hydrolase [Patescibacteria group bacterium]
MHIYASYRKPVYRQSQKKLFLIVCFITGIFCFFLIIGLFFRSNQIISPLSASTNIEIKSQRDIKPNKKSKNPNELKIKIMEAMDESIPEYSIRIEDFVSSFELSMGNSSSYIGASIHKLPIMVAVYKAIQEGKLRLDQKVLFKEEHRQDYGTGTLRYQQSGKEYTIKDLLTFMIKKSDNTAAYILAHTVLNMRDIQTTINSYGLTETYMTENTTTNKDIALLLRKLFSGNLLNSILTRDALELLYHTDFEDRLPALLPNTARVYHKVGTTIAGLHDVGVVVSPRSIYYIGIFTRGVSDEERATKAIARISRVVFDFMEE